MEFKRHILPLFTALGLAATPAAAEWRADSGLRLGSESKQGYLGVEIPFSGSLDKGFVQRAWLDWESLDYETADGAHAELRAPGAEYALGYRNHGSNGWWGGFLGLQYRDPKQSPRQAPSATHDDQWRIGIHLEGEIQLSEDWSASGRFDSYPSSGGYEVHGRLLKDVGRQGGLAIGPEVRLATDDDASAQHFAFVISGFSPTPTTKAAFKIGAERDDEGDVGPFVGVEFSRRF